MPRPPRKKGESEVKYFARVQTYDRKRKEAAKAAGKSDSQIAYERRREFEAKKPAPKKPAPKTPGQQRTERAAKTRQTIISKLPRTGLQSLQEALDPGKKKKKKR